MCLLSSPQVVYGAPNQASAVQDVDWQDLVRENVAVNDLQGALVRVDLRLLAAPEDLEARFWRARLLGWLGRWGESEEEYRRVLKRSPDDSDHLIGLANVLNALQRNDEALALLDRAAGFDSGRPDVHVTRGRTLRALDRREEAREAFRAALALDPFNADAERGLASVQEPPRHQLFAGIDVDQFNFTAQNAQAHTYRIRSALTPRWTTDFGARIDRRFGITAGRWTGALSARVSPRFIATAGGSVGPGGGIVSKGELFADVGAGVTFGQSRFVRGLDLNYQQRWLWFDGARVLTLRPSVLLYLPDEWMISAAVTVARSGFDGLGAEWHPSALTRVTFPLSESVAGHGFAAFGTENYALRDQIGSFSAQTYGGGLRVRLSDRQDITGYLAFQHRTEGRTQRSVGISHGFRF